jgi:hypothetical protein
MPLGCSTHRAAIYDRCESAKVADLDDIIQVRWERVLDGHSEAIVEIGRNGSCCKALDRIRTWRHELVIWRGNEQVWSGPLIMNEFGVSSTVLRARDRWAWLDAHAIRRDMEISGDYTDVAVELLEHALAHPDGSQDETCILPFLDARATGVWTDVEYKAYQRSMGAELRNLARGPLNATFIGRRLVLFGPYPLSTTAVLQDKDFLDDITVVEDGFSYASRVIVVGEGVIASCGGTDPYYGLVERIITDNTITTERAARALACAELSTASQPPVVVSVPSGAQLSPEAPVTISELIPGVEVPVWSKRTCREVNQRLVLTRLVVEETHAGERVLVTLAPGNSLTGEGDGALDATA